MSKRTIRIPEAVYRRSDHARRIVCSLQHGHRQAWAMGTLAPRRGNVQMGIYYCHELYVRLFKLSTSPHHEMHVFWLYGTHFSDNEICQKHVYGRGSAKGAHDAPQDPLVGRGGRGISPPQDPSLSAPAAPRLAPSVLATRRFDFCPHPAKKP